MIAVVSSTIQPSIKDPRVINRYTYKERLNQTIETVDKLVDSGFRAIFLVDNSPELDTPRLKEILNGFPLVQPFHIRQFQFGNKGINELLMLLFLTDFLPQNETIFKISGRYYPITGFVKPEFQDFACKGYQFTNKNGIISTRGYWVKNSAIYQQFLMACLEEVFAYPERIVGPRSVMRVFFKKMRDSDHRFGISIEFAAANVLKSAAFDVTFVTQLGIEGLVAGSNYEEIIRE